MFLLLFSRSAVLNSFATPWTIARQAPLSMGFPRQERWSGLPFPPPEDLPDPETEPPVSPAFFTDEPPGKPRRTYIQPKTLSSQSCYGGHGPRGQNSCRRWRFHQQFSFLPALHTPISKVHLWKGAPLGRPPIHCCPVLFFDIIFYLFIYLF